MDIAELSELFDRVKGLKVLCVGDIVLDQFIYGDTNRVSREAPVPVLEEKRREKVIGSSLAAEVTLDADGALAEDLAAIGDELRFLLLTAEVRLGPVADADETFQLDGGSLRVAVRPTDHAKCVRCWHHRADVGADSEHPELCGRCVENVAGDGETRRWG